MPCAHPCACGWKGLGRIWWPSETAGVGAGPPGCHWTPAASLQGREVSQLGLLAKAGGEPQGSGAGDRPMSALGAPSSLQKPSFHFRNLLWGGRSALEAGGGGGGSSSARTVAPDAGMVGVKYVRSPFPLCQVHVKLC